MIRREDIAAIERRAGDLVVRQLDLGSLAHQLDGPMRTGGLPFVPVATEPAPRPLTIAERCAAFDAAHPEVYAELKRLALDAVRRGRRRLGIAQLVEVARWNLATDARDDEGFKVNNSYRAVWARRLMDDEPELAGAFETRELAGDRGRR